MEEKLKDNLSSFSLTVSTRVRELALLLNGNKQNLDLLETNHKSNLVSAINEVLLVATSSTTSLEDVDIAVADYFVLHPQSFTFEQSTASTSWLIVHPLDHFPSAIVTDSAGTPWIGSISYPAPNQVLIQFNLPLAGKAVLT